VHSPVTGAVDGQLASLVCGVLLFRSGFYPMGAHGGSMTGPTQGHPELDARGAEERREQERRAYQEWLRSIGVRPATKPMPAHWVTVKPRPWWLAPFFRLYHWFRPDRDALIP
jgi:hypothetical protein